MAATGPPVAKFSNLFGQADLWDSPDVDMAPVCTVLGSGSTANQTEARTAFLNFATRSPAVIAITLAGNTDRIYIAHAPTACPARAVGFRSRPEHQSQGHQLPKFLPVQLLHGNHKSLAQIKANVPRQFLLISTQPPTLMLMAAL